MIGPQIDTRHFEMVEIFLAAKNRKMDVRGKSRVLIGKLPAHCLPGLFSEGERKGSAGYC